MIEVSAPAKIILFGEHAVVYDQPAIAVPVSSLRVSAYARQGEKLRIVIDHLNKVIDYPSPVSGDDPLIAVLDVILDALHIDPPATTIHLRSDIPIASGLGSGAAISTALGRILAQVTGISLNNERLNEIVYKTEKIHHGTPSGIDNTVIVFEQPVFFRRNHPVEQIAMSSPLMFLVADTGKRALTRTAVGDVRKLYETNPQPIQNTLNSIGAVVTQARSAIEHGDIQSIGQLMNENHRLLQTLTVSSSELDALVAASRDAGAFGAKLSGGGRGGNMIALVHNETETPVRQALLKAGAISVLTTIVETP